MIPQLDIHDVAAFLQHVLCRVDWTRDPHFQTCTTMDTLDYSGTAINEGSKVVWAAVGPPRRSLPSELPSELQLPAGFGDASRLPARRACRAGTAVRDQRWPDAISSILSALHAGSAINQFPLVVVVDDSEFTARELNNFLWVVFTRSDPAADIYGVESFVRAEALGLRAAW